VNNLIQTTKETIGILSVLLFYLCLITLAVWGVFYPFVEYALPDMGERLRESYVLTHLTWDIVLSVLYVSPVLLVAYFYFKRWWSKYRQTLYSLK